MKLINKLERKYGRYAISNLPAIMIGLYAAGYILTLIAPTVLNYLTLEPYFILHGHAGFPEIWRVITWVIVPPSSLDIFTIIMLFFYFSIGSTLEKTWGAFRFNLYIFSGILFTVIGAFILYGIGVAQGYHYVFTAGLTGRSLFSTYYINMSIFLAFALSYPDMHVLLYFIIPIKMKWMGILYGVLIIVEFINTGWAGRVAIIASLLNFIIFFLMTRNSGPSRIDPREIRRRQAYQNKVREAAPKPSAPSHAAPIHRCAICGRTEQDSDQLVFRYCSKCNGAYEYCQDHLFNHKHVE
ncbi:MAG: hypothetical protein J6S83_09620 [Lachnospiraceae bacterium]|nr:hypothetical protein [Lachnospiraceae bacterium]